MLTWAILWFTVAMHKQGVKTDPGLLVIIAMIMDAVILSSLAGAFKP